MDQENRPSAASRDIMRVVSGLVTDPIRKSVFDVIGSVLVIPQAPKQCPFHDCNQVRECFRIARLAAKDKPFKLEPILTSVGHSSNMSKLSRSLFNSLAEIF